MFMYCCPKCRKFYREEEEEKTYKCSTCQGFLNPLKVTAEVWDTMNNEEKRNHITKAIESVSSKQALKSSASNNEVPSEEKTEANDTPPSRSFFDFDSSNNEKNIRNETIVETKEISEKPKIKPKYICICKECGSVMASEDTAPICSVCNIEMKNVYIGEKVWDEKTEDQKQDVIRRVRGIEDPTERDLNSYNGSYYQSAGNSNGSFKLFRGESVIGVIIKIVSLITLILSVIGSIVIMNEISGEIGFAVLLVTSLMYLVAFGIGEMCELLGSIDRKLNK